MQKQVDINDVVFWDGLNSVLRNKKAESEQANLELLESIKQVGILRPIWVISRENAAELGFETDKGYVAISGKNRLSKARMLVENQVGVPIPVIKKLKELTVELKEVKNKKELYSLSLQENSDKEALDILSLGILTYNLAREGEKAEKIAAFSSKSPVTVGKSLRIHYLPDEIKQAFEENKVTQEILDDIATKHYPLGKAGKGKKSLKDRCLTEDELGAFQIACLEDFESRPIEDMADGRKTKKGKKDENTPENLGEENKEEENRDEEIELDGEEEITIDKGGDREKDCNDINFLGKFEKLINDALNGEKSDYEIVQYFVFAYRKVRVNFDVNKELPVLLGEALKEK